MTDAAIVESGMTFGPYPEGHCFYIEKSNCYQAIKTGVKMAEFLLLKTHNGQPPDVWVIEAKMSSPAPGIQSNLDNFIAEIRAKLSNALMLGVAVCLKRHPSTATEPPLPFRTLDLSKAKFKLVLVINGHKDSWLPPLQESLTLALNPLVKTWALPATSVAVINESLAEKHGLIIPPANATT